ncbi:MAG: hypothetical protein QW297_06455 [Candidatus Jordarchaeales archaeon]
MVRIKTSIYVDRDIWSKYRSLVTRRGDEVSRMLEEIMRDELVDEILGQILVEGERGEVDFEPVRLREGSVSEFVRAMRNGRAGSLP